MKKTIILLTLLAVVQLGYAQKLTPQTLKSIELANHKKVVANSLQYNDLQTAINSMHHIIALEGATSTYKDSLAMAYYTMGNYVSSHLLAKELLQTKPKDTGLLEINAISLQNLNATKEAITAYDQLFALTQNMAHGYQLAMLQYGIKRLAEAEATVNQALNCKAIENAYIQFAKDKTQAQNVPLKAAAHNLQGLIAFELKNYEQAKAAFDKALEITPKFTTATQNANAVLVQLQNERKLKAKEVEEE